MSPVFSIRGSVVEQLPDCPGIYKFLDEHDRPLYIGKSKSLRKRVRSHFNHGEDSLRQERMIAQTQRIDVRPTAGEIGALLLENAAIKNEMPLYNRRQRSIRRMWSISLEKDSQGYLKPQLSAYSLDEVDVTATYGAFANRTKSRQMLRSLAKRELLCPRILGLESGKGACFQHQIKQCKGACLGLESADSHNQRLQLALQSQRLSAWPITRPVYLRETAPNGGIQPEEEWHLLHNWTYMGTFTSPETVQLTGDSFMFDRDTYHILRRSLRSAGQSLLCAETLRPVSWPGTGQEGAD